MAILKPSPSSPSRFAAGTTTSVSANAEVSWRAGHLVQVLLHLHAGRVHRDDERKIPLWPLAGSVLAKTTVQAAWPAFVMKVSSR